LCFNRKQEHILPFDEHFSPVIIQTQGVLKVAPQQQPVLTRVNDLYFLEDFLGDFLEDFLGVLPIYIIMR